MSRSRARRGRRRRCPRRTTGSTAMGRRGGSGARAPPATSAPTTASTPTTSPAAPAGPATTLKPGAKGAQVRALQQALADLGYSPGKIDGSYGPATQKALTSFQRAAKLSPDGILGPKTLAALRKALGKSG